MPALSLLVGRVGRRVLTWALPCLVVGLPSRAAAADAAERRVGTLVVEAGPFDRLRTPVAVALPKELSGATLVLVAPDGSRRPLQVDPQGTGHFQLKQLARAATARFDVVRSPASQAAPVVRATRDATGVWLSSGDQRMARYRTRAVAPRPNVDEHYLRGGYLHPLLTPAGVVVTEDYPPDHAHHHGVWTAFTSTRYRGRTPDFWNMGKELGRKDHVALEGTYEGPVVAGLTARLSSTDLTVKPPVQVLAERWVLTAHLRAPGESHNLVDLEWEERVIGAHPLELPEYRYGGLGVRGRPEWLDPSLVSFLTSEGKGRLDGEGSRARWCHLGGVVPASAGSSGQAGIAVLIHPDNFRAPQPVRLHPKEPYFSVAPMKMGGFEIAPGKSFVSRYRLVAADGKAEAGELDRLWNDYAHPPAARFAPLAAGRGQRAPLNGAKPSRKR